MQAPKLSTKEDIRNQSITMYKHSSIHINEDGLILSGYQKKLKTMKKKFFVLYKDTLRNAARLEYYDNDRKFKAGLPPKRVIKLKHCFNINRRLDTKYEFVIALSTKDGSFGIVFDTEDIMRTWLEDLISLQRDKNTMSEPLQPHFEHVWQVMVQRKGLAESKGIIGNYHVCLTQKSLTFIIIGPEKSTSGETRIPKIEFLLTTIRRCGDSQCFFYMEVGRQSVIGPGELWMETEDSLRAQNMHRMILSAMSAKTDPNLEPMRKRSSSANEASKPINVIQRRQTQTDIKGNSSPQTNICFGRERCDSLPSRNRTSSECSNQSNFTCSSTLTMRNNPVHRSHSYQRHSNSPPMNSVIGCSESEESSISIDELDDNGSYVPYRYNHCEEGVIPEENTEELISSENKSNDHLSQIDNETLEENYVSMAPLRSYKDLDEHSNTSQKAFSKSRDDGKCMPLNYTQHDHNAVLDFPEYTSDNVSKIFTNDLNIQTELPARTYSIGSKVEHNKLNKRIGNLNDSEQSTMRVRAFSVGSRAKIPRCDLQRGVLFSNVVIKEQNFNSNNSISVTDTTNYKTLLNMDVSNRDKKSTSAPLLIHKSQNSVDRMSDLMEIDFSKSTNITTANNSNQHRPYQQQLATKSGKSAANLTTVGNYDLNRTNRFDSTSALPTTTATTTNASSGGTCSVRDSPTHDENIGNLKTQTDNGYLEMKPVGGGGSGNGLFTKNSTNTSSLNRYLGNSQNHANTMTNTMQSIISENVTYIPKIAESNTMRNSKIALAVQQQQQAMQSQSLMPVCENKFESVNTKGCTTGKYIDGEQNKDALVAEKFKSCLDNNDPTSLRNNKINSLNAINLSSKLAQMNLNVTENHENKANMDSRGDNRNADEKILTNYAAICKNNSLANRKLRQDNIINNTNDGGGVNINSNANANNILDLESGYEILQIKSDSSLLLQGNKNRPSSIRSKQQQQQATHQQQSHLLSQQNQMKQKSQSTAMMSTLSSNITTNANCNNTILTSQNMVTAISNNLGVGICRNAPNFKIQSTMAVAPSTTAATTITTTTLSRPPSVSSEHGLYYASLDLPQSSAEISSKTTKVGDTLIESSPVNIPDVNNSYAKIDFDHSDSSSSSSKNMNI